MEKLISPRIKDVTGDGNGLRHARREVSPVDGEESASDSLEEPVFSEGDRTPSEVSSEHDDGMSGMEEPDGKKMRRLRGRWQINRMKKASL